MRSLRVVGFARLLAVLATAAALPAAVKALGPWPLPAEGGAAPLVVQAAVGAASPDSLEEKVVARDPFRAARRPARVGFDPNPTPPPPADPPPPKPTLALTGIMWGAEPSAVIEGIPGFESAQLVRVGEAVAGFRIRRITAHEVTVTGMDTTWVLQVRKPW